MPFILALVPVLVHLAENIFSSPSTATTPDGTVVQVSKGAEKKAFVMDLLGELYDRMAPREKLLAYVPRSIFLEVCSFIIDRAVPYLTAPAAPSAVPPPSA